MDEPESKSVVRRTTENQLAIRSSKKLANVTAAYGAYMQTRPLSKTVYKKNPARYHRSGTRYVGATTSRFTEHYTSEGGRNFRATDGSNKARLAMGRRVVYAGRLVPVLGYGYVIHNTLTGSVPGNPDVDMASRTVQGATILSAVSAGEQLAAGRSPLETIDATLGAKPGYGLSSVAPRIMGLFQ